MAKETRDDIPFQRAVEIACRIDMIRSQGREAVSEKWPRHFGGFSGALSGGRCSFGRGHPHKIVQSSLQVAHGASGSRESYRSYLEQPAFSTSSTPISAHCYRVTKVVIRSVRPARGRSQGAKSGGQATRGGGQQDNGRSMGGGQSGGAQPHLYTFPARHKAESSDAVITGIVPIFHRDASVLFYPGSTYSYVSSYFSSHPVMPRDSLSALVYLSMPVGDSIVVDCVYRSCVVSIGSYKTMVDLLLLDMVHFEIILGIDYLSPYHAIF
ncbi:uncharacterized protein [Nicotiana tomentosiformis]|uniref:uncharacterized protein n=1 Tax=Nicotiana tomentosiformis TaxID=4098 RepID=UPI00388C36CF